MCTLSHCSLDTVYNCHTTMGGIISRWWMGSDDDDDEEEEEEEEEGEEAATEQDPDETGTPPEPHLPPVLPGPLPDTVQGMLYCDFHIWSGSVCTNGGHQVGLFSFSASIATNYITSNCTCGGF